MHDMLVILAIKPLFDNPMSKHSVGAYMELHAKVGRSFWAVRSHETRRVLEGSTELHSQLETSPPNHLNSSNLALLGSITKTGQYRAAFRLFLGYFNKQSLLFLTLLRNRL